MLVSEPRSYFLTDPKIDLWNRVMQLVIDDVSKLYKGRVWGLRNFSLRVGPGVLGLVGPNGAGKSTLMRILATITRPSGGRVTWNGTDIVQSPNQLRTVLGYLPQEFGVYPNLNVIEFLQYLAHPQNIFAKPPLLAAQGQLQRH